MAQPLPQTRPYPTPLLSRPRLLPFDELLLPERDRSLPRALHLSGLFEETFFLEASFLEGAIAFKGENSVMTEAIEILYFLQL